jgi:hypothetical protein
MPVYIPIVLPQLYESLGIFDYAAQSAVQALLAVCALAGLFRVLLCIAYQNMAVVFKLQAKSFTRKEDIAKIKHGLFARTVKAYMLILEKGVSAFSAREIAEKEFGRAGFLIANYQSVGKFIVAVENSALVVSLIFAVIYPGNSAGAGVVLFALLKILSLFFDFQTMKAQVLLDITAYIETEIAQFYAKDTVSSINLLRLELKNAMQAQAETFKDAIHHFGGTLSLSMEKTLSAVEGSVEKTMRTLLNSAEALTAPLGARRTALAEAAKSQEKLKITIDGINTTLGGVGKLSEVIDGGLGRLTENMKGMIAPLSGQVAALTGAAEALKAGSRDFSEKNSEIAQQIAYIKTNQQALDTSLQQYELTLKLLSSQIGDGIGKIIEFHAQEAYQTMRMGLQDNLKTTVNANNELIARLQTLFEQMQAQSRSETSAILSIKEQMDIYFESNGKRGGGSGETEVFK